MAKKNNPPAPDADWDEGNGESAPESQAAPAAPGHTAEEGAAKPAPVAEKLPSDLKEAFALLHKVEHSPERLPGQTAEEGLAYGKARLARLERVRKHVGALQQGSPVVEIGANEQAAGSQKRNLSLQRERWENLALHNPTAKEILDAHDALAKKVAAPKK